MQLVAADICNNNGQTMLSQGHQNRGPCLKTITLGRNGPKVSCPVDETGVSKGYE
jgi:hypothetical protein